jgi:hypothetical protein
MQIVIEQLNGLASSGEAVFKHGSCELYWAMRGSEIKKAEEQITEEDGLDTGNIFHYLNRYWATLDRVTQDKIADCYGRINRLTRDIMLLGLESTSIKIRQEIAELLSYHDLAEIENWMMLYSDIQIPTGLSDNFTVNEGRIQGTREKTYLKRDYIKLVAMIIGLKSVLPVLMSYTDSMGETFGTTWKEYEAFGLLNFSTYYECEAMQRLRLYVETSLNKVDNLASATIDGLSRVDFPEWLVAVTLVRRLLIADIRGIQNSTGSPALMRALYKYVNERVNRYDIYFQGTVRQKLEEGDNGGDRESNTSRLEGFKAREELTGGDIQEIEIFFEDPINDTYLQIDRRYDKAIKLIPVFQQIMTVFNDIDKVTNSVPVIRRWQHAIVELVLRDYLPPRSLGIISKEIELNCFAVAMAFLWVDGFKDLVLVLSSIDQFKVRAIEPSINKVSKENTEILVELFPHEVKGNKRQDRYKNAGIAGIDVLIRDIIQYDRRINPNLPLEMRDELGLRQSSSSLPINPELRDRLAQLVIELRKD